MTTRTLQQKASRARQARRRYGRKRRTEGKIYRGSTKCVGDVHSEIQGMPEKQQRLEQMRYEYRLWKRDKKMGLPLSLQEIVEGEWKKEIARLAAIWQYEKDKDKLYLDK